jgi:hypothetical protein
VPIVTSTYRYKRPPGKRKPVAIAGPRIVTPPDPKKSRRPSLPSGKAAAQVLAKTTARTPAGDVQSSTEAPPPANDDRKPPPPAGDRKSAIVTVPDRKTVQRQREQQQMAKLMQGGDEGPEIRPGSGTQPPDTAVRRSAIVTMRSAGEDMTPEEHKRRGDAADALFREIKRRIGAARPGDARPPPKR